MAFVRAITSGGTANALHALLFGSDHVKSRKTDDQHHRTDQNIVSKSHKITSIPTKVLMKVQIQNYFSVYSFFIFLSALMTRNTRRATISAVTTQPTMGIQMEP